MYRGMQYENGFILYCKIIVILCLCRVFINGKNTSHSTHRDIFVFPVIHPGKEHTNVQTHIKYIIYIYLHHYVIIMFRNISGLYSHHTISLIPK